MRLIQSFKVNIKNCLLQTLCNKLENYKPESSSMPYQRRTMVGMIDIKEELKVAEEFWDFIGGQNSYNLLLEAFEEVGIEMKDDIDSYFANIR